MSYSAFHRACCLLMPLVSNTFGAETTGPRASRMLLGPLLFLRLGCLEQPWTNAPETVGVKS